LVVLPEKGCTAVARPSAVVAFSVMVVMELERRLAAKMVPLMGSAAIWLVMLLVPAAVMVVKMVCEIPSITTMLLDCVPV